jgi:alkylhydroperoxidase family enzyme
MSTYLAPIERPSSPVLKLAFFFMRRRFGKVLTPLAVFSARLPLAFTTFYGKVAKLDKKLELPAATAVLIRQQVASINMCLFCMDASRWFATQELGEDVARLDALPRFETSPLFTDAERAALAYATELAREHRVDPETFERLARYYDEREICEIVWLVASEHLYNISNIGLDIGSDGLCEARPLLTESAL